MSERQLQDTGVLPGPKLKYHCCSSATEEEENKNNKNKKYPKQQRIQVQRIQKLLLGGAPTAQKVRNRIGVSPTGKGIHFRQAFALSSVSRILFRIVGNLVGAASGAQIQLSFLTVGTWPCSECPNALSHLQHLHQKDTHLLQAPSHLTGPCRPSQCLQTSQMAQEVKPGQQNHYRSSVQAWLVEMGAQM